MGDKKVTLWDLALEVADKTEMRDGFYKNGWRWLDLTLKFDNCCFTVPRTRQQVNNLSPCSSSPARARCQSCELYIHSGRVLLNRINMTLFHNRVLCVKAQAIA